VSGEELRAAVAAAALGSEDLRRSLLGSIVEVARAILGARASSIVLLDEDAGELVFEAVAGEGESLLGTRIPAARGIAGWVAQSGEALFRRHGIGPERIVARFRNRALYAGVDWGVAIELIAGHEEVHAALLSAM